MTMDDWEKIYRRKFKKWNRPTAIQDFLRRYYWVRKFLFWKMITFSDTYRGLSKATKDRIWQQWKEARFE